MTQGTETKVALTFEIDAGEGQNGDIALFTLLFGRAMLEQKVNASLEIEQKFANGLSWSLSLVDAEIGGGQLLKVTLPVEGQDPLYFRPLDEESWPRFVALVKTDDAETGIARDARSRIPEVATVSFRNEKVAFPRSLARKNNPVLVRCTESGAFSPTVTTLELVTKYFAMLPVATADSTN